MKVKVIGVGMGAPGLLTVEAKEAIDTAEYFVGAQRLLDEFAPPGKPRQTATLPVEIERHLKEAEGVSCAVVLVSGDVGFFSAASGLQKRLQWCEAEYLCGISSLQYFCAKIGRPWENVETVSLHGRDEDPAVKVLMHTGVFFLTGGKWKVHTICQRLCEAGLGDLPVWAGERLSYPDERIAAGTAAQLAAQEFGNLAVLLVENQSVKQNCFSVGMPDERFIRGAAPMTKSEVRAVILSKMAPQDGDVIWDVGAGTGSVSVELALTAPHAAVFGVECEESALELAKQNRALHGAGNLALVYGHAPEALETLPAPDRVFIGGSGKELEQIIAAAVRKNPQVHLVLSAVTLETPAEALAYLEKYGFSEPEVVQIAVSRAKKAGARHLMAAQNPVTVITADAKGREDGK